MATRLTEHFTLEELTHSDTAAARGLDNTPTPDVAANLLEVAKVLEYVRRIAGARPIKVSSGYRSLKLNSIIGSKPSSMHVQGLAADINAVGLSAKELVTLVAPHVQELGIDQLISENSGGTTWVHIGLAREDREPRNQVFSIVDGRSIGGIV